MHFIDEVAIEHKTILLRVDFNVSLNPNHSISDDERIRQSIPTLEYLLKHHNKLILTAHLGEPEKPNPADSLIRVAKRLQEYLPKYKVVFVHDFEKEKETLEKQKPNEIIMLENIRFQPGETTNDPELAKRLSALAEIYVNDAFGVSHRKHASVVGLPKILPSYGGLLLKKEITMLDKIIRHPQKPYVAIIGGKKIATKIQFITKLTTIADYLLLGGGLANTLLAAQGFDLGDSMIGKDELQQAKHILEIAKKEHTEIVLPSDVVVGPSKESKESTVKKIGELNKHDGIFDIGPETQATFGTIIASARTIVWNGPVGYIENPVFKRGTDFLYYAITNNDKAVSVVGGGDTLAAIAKKEYLDKITHISTGGGAMLEFMENGTLPGIEALKEAKNN
jgi:phosphoglycerate kinase